MTLGGAGDGKIHVQVKGDGQAKKIAVPFHHKNFTAIKTVDLKSSANKYGEVYIDNWSFDIIRKNGEVRFTEKNDYEKPVYVSGLMNNFKKTGRAKVFYTDKHAASGKMSLAIYDDVGLKNQNAPFFKRKVLGIGLNIYCPLLAEDVIVEKGVYRSLNWGLVPQVKTIHRSPILYYVQTRDVGDGVIEITYVVHNFSVDEGVVFNWLNAPWGGTRITSLPKHYVCTPEGKLVTRDKIMKRSGVTELRKTGGWNISCATDAPDSPSLALVFGRDKNLESELKKQQEGKPYCQIKESKYRDMTTGLPADWKERPENTHRNYDVAVVIPQFNLAPGKTIWYRSYMVINSKKKAIWQAKSLVDKVDYGLCDFDPVTTAKLGVTVKDGKVLHCAAKKADFKLFSKPVTGTMPLFLLESNKHTQDVVTSDMYMFVPQEKLSLDIPKDYSNYEFYKHTVGYSLIDNAGKWKKLLGYAYTKKPQKGNYRKLSKLLDKKIFPETNKYHVDLWVEISN